MNSVGILGLGIIGTAWAARYRAAGHLGGVWNRSPKPEEAGWVSDPVALVRAVDLVQIVVADPPAVEALIERILPALGPGKCLVQSSTIDPESSRRFEERVRSSGAAYIEAPFTGSKPAAIEGKTVFFLGGRDSEIDAAEALLSDISEQRFRIGTGAQAASLKLAMNLNLAIQMEALSESLTYARRAGIDDALFYRVLEKNVGYSGLAKLKENKLKTADFSPQFSVKHMHKDMRLASATSGCAELPLLEAAREQLKLAEKKGLGDDDFSSLIRLL